MRYSAQECATKFGAVENGKWELASYWCAILMVPSNVAAKLINTATGQPASHVYCNKDMMPALLKTFQNIEDRGLLSELKSFDGCFMVRNTRGENSPSAHCWALAIDLNAAENPLGGPVKFSDAFLQCFRDTGFTCGSDFHRVDGMHFSWAGF